MDGHDAAELRDDLLDDLRRAGGDHGDARAVPLMVHLRDRQALDVVAAPGKEADDAREHAGLVVHDDRERVALGRVLAVGPQVVGRMARRSLGDVQGGHWGLLDCDGPALFPSRRRERKVLLRPGRNLTGENEPCHTFPPVSEW